MMEMLELSDRFLKSHKNTQRAITNTVETNGKIKSPSKQIKSVRKKRRYKEEPKGNFRTEKCNNQILNLSG